MVSADLQNLRQIRLDRASLMPQVVVDGVALYVSSEGPSGSEPDDTAVVLLHGFARSGWFWKGWVPILADRYRVVRPDIRGCGRSADPLQPFRLEDAATDVLGVADALGINRMHFVGESTGGMAGVVAASLCPERFKSLTLISTPLSPSRGDSGVMSPGAASPVESMKKFGLETWWLKSRGTTQDVFGDERDTQAAREFARTPLHVAINMWEAMHDPTLTIEPYLGNLSIPVLVMTPTGSQTVSSKEQAELVEAIPGATQIVYPDQPHFVFLLDPARLAEDCRSFIEAVDRTGE